MTYEQLENYLSEQLQGYFFDCNPLPDIQKDFNTSLVRPRVFVCYDASDYSDSENLGMTIQEDKIRIGFDIEALRRRGKEGIFAIRDIIQEKILGLKILGYDKLQMLSFSPLQPSNPNSWHYYLQFSTVGHVSESQPDETAPLLKTPEVLEYE